MSSEPAWLRQRNMGPSLDATWEYRQSMRMRPACEAVYRDVFGIDVRIERYEYGTPKFVFDQEFGIDVRLTLPNGISLLGQEKALSATYAHYNTFTMEYHQNRFTKEEGEFFKLTAQFYFSGYESVIPGSFSRWHILKVFDLMAWLKQFPSRRLERKVRPAGGSRADFIAIPYANIPPHIIYADGGDGRETHIDKAGPVELEPQVHQLPRLRESPQVRQ